MHTTPRVLATLTALLLAAPAAQAASPENGTLTKDANKVEWSGEAMGSVVQFAHFFNEGQIVEECYEQICDSFTLQVKDTGILTISAEDASGYTEMQVLDEDGNEVFWSGGDDAVPTVYTEVIDKPVTYTVEVLTDAIAPEIDDASYSAFAELTQPEDEEPVEEEE